MTKLVDECSRYLSFESIGRRPSVFAVGAGHVSLNQIKLTGERGPWTHHCCLELANLACVHCPHFGLRIGSYVGRVGPESLCFRDRASSIEHRVGAGRTDRVWCRPGCRRPGQQPGFVQSRPFPFLPVTPFYHCRPSRTPRQVSALRGAARSCSLVQTRTQPMICAGGCNCRDYPTRAGQFCGRGYARFQYLYRIFRSASAGGWCRGGDRLAGRNFRVEPLR
ncbi:hypothetical protein M2428_000998 [Arthrobacter sp. ES3-54]|nr:hypothetical protein [Arthrobacter sp. ES3-54]